MEHIRDQIEKIQKIQSSYSAGNYVEIDKLHKILQLCTQLTNGYDSSHDVTHHINVYHNSLIILDSYNRYSNIEFMSELVTYSSLLHDTIDYKYGDSTEKSEKLVQFLIEQVGLYSTDIIMWIINNISYSKEVVNGYPVGDDDFIQSVRDIVSDADKLEALGKVGIDRCYAYTRSKNINSSESEITQIVINHCHEKLLILKDYIRTSKGKQLAKPLTDYIQNFVNSNGKPITNGKRCRIAYPTKVPVIVNYEPDKSTHKYLVDQDAQIVTLLNNFREKYSLKSGESLFVIVNRSTVELTSRFSVLYDKHRNRIDDFLYVYICKEKTFG